MKSILGKMKRAAAGVLSDLREKYPPIPDEAEKIKIGSSHDKNPLYAYKFGNGTQSIVFSSGIHGNEVGTVKLAHKIISWLHNDAEIPADLSIYVVPVINPDGFHLAKKNPNYFSGGKVGRLNAKGVDLNRNFDAKSFSKTSQWSFGKNYGESVEVYAGEIGGSEPETSAICKFLKKIDAKLWVSFHNAGSDVLASKDPAAIELAKIFTAETGFTQLEEKEWRELHQTGTPKEWCEENGISFIEVEGSARWTSDWPTVRKALPKVIKELARR